MTGEMHTCYLWGWRCSSVRPSWEFPFRKGLALAGLRPVNRSSSVSHERRAKPYMALNAKWHLLYARWGNRIRPAQAIGPQDLS